MKFHNSTADIFVPNGEAATAALSRTTHLGICAHQDDLEILAFHGISECFDSDKLSFTGITCTDGAGCALTGPYANLTRNEIRKVRCEEQRKAALIGSYGAMLQLDYASADACGAKRSALADDIAAVLRVVRPQILYTHNPADKHRTHLAVLLAVLEACRTLPASQRPERIYGCEGWRNLDWLPDKHKIRLDVSRNESLALSLLTVFDSQIAGGKRYDLAAEGRRRANATYDESHKIDQARAVTFAVDLTPLFMNDSLDPLDFTLALVDEFKEDVRRGLADLIGEDKRSRK